MTPTLDDLEILAWRVIGFDQASAVNMWEERNDRNAEMGWDLDGALEKRFGCDFSGFCHLAENCCRYCRNRGLRSMPPTGREPHDCYWSLFNPA